MRKFLLVGATLVVGVVCQPHALNLVQLCPFQAHLLLHALYCPCTVAVLPLHFSCIALLSPSLSFWCFCAFSLHSPFAFVLPKCRRTGQFICWRLSHSLPWCSAYRDVDESEQEFMGSKLVVSFANPAKHYDTHAIRPQSTGVGSALVGGLNSKAGLRGNTGSASSLLAGHSGLASGSKPGFNDRLSPAGFSTRGRSAAFGWLDRSIMTSWKARNQHSQDLVMPPGNFGAAGQLGAGAMGFNNDDMAVRLQQQTMQMQQVLFCSLTLLICCLPHCRASGIC